MAFPIFTMSHDKELQCKKYSTLVGCCILFLSNGVFWYWGNMAVYCMSYFVSVLQTPSGVDSPWVYALYSTFWTLNTLVSNKIASRIGKRMTILLGILIYDIGIFCSYFAMQNSLLALTITMGLLTGAGTGFMDASAMAMAVDWNRKSPGFISALIQGSLSLGALVINELVTRYINPRNLSPDFFLNPTTYFTQKEVLDKVPSMFLILGCFTTSMHFIGFAMLRQRPSSKKPDQKEVCEKPSEETALTRQRTTAVIDTVKETKPYFECAASNNGDHICDRRNEGSDYTYKQMLKTKSFYAYWIYDFMCSVPFMLIGNYYKTFGQIWIKDDYFITTIGTASAIVNTLLSPSFGLSVDFFGVKKCQIITTICLVSLLFWYYFTARLNQWIYFVVTLALGSISGAVTASMVAATLKQYGRTHFTTNLGWIMTSQLCFNMISPYMVGFLLRNIGWFLTFAGSGALLTMTLIPTILFLPNV